MAVWGLTEEEVQEAVGGLGVDDILIDGTPSHEVVRKWAESTGAGDVATQLAILTAWRRLAGYPTKEGVQEIVTLAPEGVLGPEEQRLREFCAGADSDVPEDIRQALAAMHGFLWPQFLQALDSRLHPAIQQEVKPPDAPAPESGPLPLPPELPWGLTEEEARILLDGHMSISDLMRGDGPMASVYRKWAQATGNQQAAESYRMFLAVNGAQKSYNNGDLIALVDSAPNGTLGRRDEALRKYAAEAHEDGRIGIMQQRWLGELHEQFWQQVQDAWGNDLYPAARQAGLAMP